MTRIELAIDELILDGVANIDQAELVQAIEQELAGLIQGGGIPETWSGPRAPEALNGGVHQVPPAASTRTVGAQVAQAIVGAGGSSNGY